MTALPDAILWPVALHLVLVLTLFLFVGVARMRAVRRGDVPGVGHFARKGAEPEGSRRYAANLANQFELPTFFYALVALLYAAEAVTGVQVLLAWVFLIGRVIHAVIHTRTDNVPLRGGVFGINFLALAGMWAIFLLPRLFPSFGTL